MRENEDNLARLGHYRLDERLGRGGMGEVFLAWDERLERRVALKRILPDPPPDAQARARFRNEARAAARLSHPSIVQVYELLETAGGDCLVMEYVEGRGLVELIAEGELDAATSLRLAAEIAEGLAEAHTKGLVHRDLKPENIHITTESRASAGSAKILDFGLARLLWSEGRDRDSLAEAAFTRSGMLVGTVHAMSPEQASGRPVDHRSDLFALGGLLYEMLTGRSPFRGHNVLDTLRRVTSEEPEPLAELRPDLPPAVVELVQGLLAKAPERRPQNALLVSDSLRRLRAEMESAEGSPVAPPLHHHPIPPAGSPQEAEADLPTGEWPLPRADAGPGETAVRTLLLVELVGHTRMLEDLGDARAAEVFARHDRAARDLLARWDGLEIDKNDGFLFLFERPAAAVAFAIAYHRRLAELAEELTLELAARAGIHLGEVWLRPNLPEDISRGAKPLEVEGLARAITARVAKMASPHQTLLTAGAFELARRSGIDAGSEHRAPHWSAHGEYLLTGMEEPMELFEAGLEALAPLLAPADSEHGRRVVSTSDERLLGWRPAPGQRVPRRPGWLLERRLEDQGLGEAWVAGHASGEKRLLKFCFEASRLRILEREAAFFRLLKEALGRRDDIVRILDWSFEEAPFFLETEYSATGDLSSWVEEEGGLGSIPLEKRLDLVAQVGDALAAAHSVAVLHRGLGPTKILVEADSAGRPRILLGGFDVAGDSGDPDPVYGAPELWEGADPTVGSDLYALGVLLYQVAVGDLSRILAPGWQRDLDDDLLAADIARIVDRDPELRPASAYEIVADLRALPERRDEIAVRRNARETRRQLEDSRHRRRQLAGLAALLLLLLLALGLQERRAVGEAARARYEAETARQVSEFLVDLFESADPSLAPGEISSVRDLLDRGRETLPYRLHDRPELEAVLMSTLGRVYGNLGAYDDALPLLQGAVERLGESFEASEPQRAASLHELARLRFARGESELALGGYRQALALRRVSLGDHHPEVAANLNDLGLALLASGDLDGAEAHLREALEIHRRIFGEEHRSIAAGLHNLARVFQAQGDPTSAEEYLRQALDMQRRLLGEAHPDIAVSLNNLGVFLYHRGQVEEAEELLRSALDQKRRIFGERHPEVAASLNNLAVLLRDAADIDVPRRLYAETLIQYRELFLEPHPHLANALVNAAQFELERGDPTRAEGLAREARQVYRSLLPEADWRLARVESLLGASLGRQGHLDQAEELLARSHAGLRAHHGNDAEVTRRALEWLLEVREQAGSIGGREPRSPTS